MNIHINKKDKEKVRKISLFSNKHNHEKKQNETGNSDQLYLDKFKFNPELKKGWLNFFIVNFRVVILLIVLISSWGLYSFFLLPRESNPEVRIPYAMVMTTYPGASPSDIEELVTKPLESGLSGLKDLKQITSNSSNSVSSITVEFDAKADLDASIRKLNDEVNSLKSALPDEANEPVVREISFDDSPIWTIAVSGPYDGLTLRESAETIQEELETIAGVREVVVSGGEKIELEIAYDPQKLTSLNLSPSQVNQIVAGYNIAIPAGTFKGRDDNFTYPVRVDSRYYSVEELRALPIMHSPEGAVLTLSDVAEVSEKPREQNIYSRLSSKGGEPQNNVTVRIVKKTGSSILDTIDEAEKKTDAVMSKLPEGINYSVTLDMGEYIEQDFDQLQHDFILTLILVFLVLFLIIGLKEALVASLAIPLAFFSTFIVMNAVGISLNFLSVFSLILALGLLVDDAIVVVSATKQYLRSGKFTPEQAVLLVLNDFKAVLTTTTLTTVWAFLPLLMASGIIGEFIKSIPITVSVTFIASLIIALIINHPLSAILERIRLTKKLYSFFLFFIFLFSALSLLLPNKVTGSALAIVFMVVAFFLIRWYFYGGKRKLEHSSRLVEREWQDDELIKKKLKEQGSHENDNLGERLLHGIIHFNALLPYYERALRKILKSKKSRLKVIAFTTLLFIIAISLPISGIVKNEFFPVSDQGYIYVNVEGPPGLRLEETDKTVRKVEEVLLTHQEIDNFTTIVGAPTSDDFSAPMSSSSHLASITVKLVDAEFREKKSYELAGEIRKEVKDLEGANITVEVPSSGPPSGAVFEARLSGDDLQVLDTVSSNLADILEEVSGSVNVKTSLNETPPDYTFSLNHNRLELYGLNAAYVGSMLRLAISGTEVTTILRDGEEISVMARFDKDKIPSLEAASNLQIINNQGQAVFLSDVAEIELKPSVETILRVDQSRTVAITAAAEDGANSATLLEGFQEKLKDYELPAGYEISYGGENAQNEESVISIIQAMAVAIMLILATMIIQFNSVRKSLIVIATIPLALIGVFIGLGVARISLSFPGLIGILALFGIVVKNAIILIDKINLNLKNDIPFKEAIVDAGKSRLEAIFITSICTILGIIPITLSNEVWRSLGGAIIFGLMLSSFLTLFIVPTLFMSLIKDKPQRKL